MPDAAHSLHAVEEGFGKAGVSEEVVVEEVEVLPWEPFHFGEGFIDTLGVKGFPSLKKSLFVTEIAM